MKYARQIGSYSPNRDENKNYLKPASSVNGSLPSGMIIQYFFGAKRYQKPQFFPHSAFIAM